jgi:hypothetical protein
MTDIWFMKYMPERVNNLYTSLPHLLKEMLWHFIFTPQHHLIGKPSVIMAKLESSGVSYKVWN